MRATCRNRLLVVALSAVLLVMSPAIAEASPPFVTGQVTRDAFWQMNPDVNGRRMVYYDDRTGNGDIYLLDRDTSPAPQRLTSTNDWENEPAIDGNHVVFTRQSGGDFSIWMKTLGGGDPVRLSPPDGNDHRYARVSGNWVVWEATLPSGTQLYYYDIAGAHAHTVPLSTALYGSSPDVSGNIMTFVYASGGTDRIGTYTIGAGMVVEQPTLPGNKYHPRISGTRIVWSDDRNLATTGRDIYTCTVGGNDAGVFSAEAGDETVPDIDGDVVVWARDDTSGSGHVWRKQVSGTAVQLSSGDAEGRPAISGNTVAWQSYGYDASNHYVTGDVYLTFMPYAKGYTRYAGADRFATAVAASNWYGGGGRVILTTGRNWPDALGGASLAGLYSCPILLTERYTLPAVTRDRLAALSPSVVMVLGGPATVDTAVVSAVAAAVPGAAVERIGGADRYGTANLIALRVKTTPGTGYDGHVFVATGLRFPDALAAAPLMFKRDAPVFLVGKYGLTAGTKTAMTGATHVVILGDTNAVSQDVEDELRGMFPAPGAVERVAGEDRYLTAAWIASFGVNHLGLDWATPALAKGTDFPDALAAGPTQGNSNSVMLLTKPDDLPDVSGAMLWSHRSPVVMLRLFGGPTSVSEYVKGRAALSLE